MAADFLVKQRLKTCKICHIWEFVYMKQIYDDTSCTICICYYLRKEKKGLNIYFFIYILFINHV